MLRQCNVIQSPKVEMIESELNPLSVMQIIIMIIKKSWTLWMQELLQILLYFLPLVSYFDPIFFFQ